MLVLLVCRCASAAHLALSQGEAETFTCLNDPGAQTYAQASLSRHVSSFGRLFVILSGSTRSTLLLLLLLSVFGIAYCATHIDDWPSACQRALARMLNIPSSQLEKEKLSNIVKYRMDVVRNVSHHQGQECCLTALSVVGQCCAHILTKSWVQLRFCFKYILQTKKWSKHILLFRSKQTNGPVPLIFAVHFFKV